mgnify:CR=1 FL=1
MKKHFTLFLLLVVFMAHPVFAQEDDFDFSTLVPAEEVKAFCSSRIINGGPQKLVSLGYDVQGRYDMNVGAFANSQASEYRVNSSEFRIDVQYPLVSRNNITLAVQFNYLDTRYNFENEVNENDHPFAQTLNENGLTSTSLAAVVFKPLNLKNFLLIQAGGTLNGDYTLSNLQGLEYTRFFAATIFGWKPSDRKMWGLGVSRTYLGGALNYLPVLYYQYSSADGKWGVDALLPSRLNIKRNFSKKTILSLGTNFQGNTYRLNVLANRSGDEGLNPELRRSELRFRAILDQAITSTIWLSAQAGLRYNWDFNVDDGDFFRGLFSEDPYLFENSLGNPFFVQFSLSWVSP